jgi:hypothetical protein
MNRHRALEHAAMGAAAGVIGTFVMQGLLAARKKYAPNTMPPIRKDPGKFMVEQAEHALPETVRRNIPDTVESTAAGALSLGYGATFGALYGITRGSSQHTNAPSEVAFLEGPIMGLVTWAAGYLGWLPATGLMPPPWKQEPARAIVPVVEHALFGVVTAVAFKAIHHLAHVRASDGDEQ